MPQCSMKDGLKMRHTHLQQQHPASHLRNANGSATRLNTDATDHSIEHERAKALVSRATPSRLYRRVFRLEPLTSIKSPLLKKETQSGSNLEKKLKTRTLRASSWGLRWWRSARARRCGECLCYTHPSFLSLPICCPLIA
jgi:hypothetical protein